MNNSTPPPIEHVQHDLPCNICAYNVRGLPIDGHCPECGSGVQFSLQGHLVRYSSPAWAQKLARGATLVIYSTIAFFTFLFVASALSCTVTKHPPLELIYAIEAVFLITLTMHYRGWYMLTTRDPSRRGENRYVKSRRSVRILLPLGLIGPFAFFTLNMHFRRVESSLLDASMVPVYVAVLILCWFLQLHYIRKFEYRLPNSTIRKQARFLQAFVMVVLLAVMLPFIHAFCMTPGTKVYESISDNMLWIAPAISILVVIWGMLYFLMLAKLATLLQEHSFIARIVQSTSPEPTH